MTIIHEEQGIDKTLERRFEYFIKRFKINKILRKIGASMTEWASSPLPAKKMG